ncbi:MAG: hypothetical protein WCK41_12715 [Actinomycetes bacterium]
MSTSNCDEPADFLAVAAADAYRAVNKHPNPERAECEHRRDNQRFDGPEAEKPSNACETM